MYQCAAISRCAALASRIKRLFEKKACSGASDDADLVLMMMMCVGVRVPYRGSVHDTAV